MSFGSWVGLTVGARDPRVSALLGVAMPVNRWGLRRGRDLSEAEILHPRRTRRDICGFQEITAFYARAAEPKELVIIDGSDHLFNGVVSEVADAVEELLGDWNGQGTSHE